MQNRIDIIVRHETREKVTPMQINGRSASILLSALPVLVVRGFFATVFSHATTHRFS